MKLMPKQLDTREWHPTALTLVQEHRTCRACASVTVVPNTELMVRIVNPLFRTLDSRLIKRSMWPGDIEDLPHEVQVERSSCERCHHCFHGEPAGQLLLFPLRQRTRPTFKEVLAMKQGEWLAEDLGRREKDGRRRAGKAEKPITEKQRNRMKARAVFARLRRS